MSAEVMYEVTGTDVTGSHLAFVTAPASPGDLQQYRLTEATRAPARVVERCYASRTERMQAVRVAAEKRSWPGAKRRCATCLG